MEASTGERLGRLERMLVSLQHSSSAAAAATAPGGGGGFTVPRRVDPDRIMAQKAADWLNGYG